VTIRQNLLPEVSGCLLRKENYGTICSEYYHNKKYQIRTDKSSTTCTVLKSLLGIMDFLVALGFILAAVAVIFWITKPR